MYFTLADYNVDVLRLVTLPNLLLTWAMHLPVSEEPLNSSSQNPMHVPNSDHGELDIKPELLSAFQQHISSQGIILAMVSGSWLPTKSFLSLLPTAPELSTFVMASETIYSRPALRAFTEVLAGILKEVRMGKAVVAAKRVYFGVGGSVEEFRRECSTRGMVAYEMPNEDGFGEGGVSRVVMEVQTL
jgi:protein-histidine N-methyltransferase